MAERFTKAVLDWLETSNVCECKLAAAGGGGSHRKLDVWPINGDKQEAEVMQTTPSRHIVGSHTHYIRQWKMAGYRLGSQSKKGHRTTEDQQILLLNFISKMWCREGLKTQEFTCHQQKEEQEDN